MTVFGKNLEKKLGKNIEKKSSFFSPIFRFQGFNCQKWSKTNFANDLDIETALKRRFRARTLGFFEIFLKKP